MKLTINNTRKKLKAGFVLLATVCSSFTFGQITNDNINIGTKPSQVFYDGFNDVSSDGEPWYYTQIYWVDGDFWSEPVCHGFATPSVPHVETVTDPGVIWTGYLNMSFDQEIDLYMAFWEDDNGETCNYNADGANPDDDYYEGYVAFSGGGNTRITGSDRRQSQWFTNHNASTGGWIIPDSDIWDIKLATTWRYTAGSSCGDPLIFEPLTAGETHYNLNSNDRSIDDTHIWVANTFAYENVANNTSADVYYSFTITEELKVTISTDHPDTDFDTYLRLYNEGCGAVIAEDDDGGAANTSVIEEVLFPGTYIIQVEGYAGNEGFFDLSVSAGGPVSGLESNEPILSSLKVYPNPANDFVQVDLKDQFSEGATLEIIDLMGRTIYSAPTLQEQISQIDLTEFQAGSYLIRVSDGTQTVIEPFIHN